VYIRISEIYVQGSVIIFNFLKYGLQLDVLEILTVNLIAFFFVYFKNFLKISNISPK
jgi:hypothetical protein